MAGEPALAALPKLSGLRETEDELLRADLGDGGDALFRHPPAMRVDRVAGLSCMPRRDRVRRDPMPAKWMHRALTQR